MIDVLLIVFMLMAWALVGGTLSAIAKRQLVARGKYHVKDKIEGEPPVFFSGVIPPFGIAFILYNMISHPLSKEEKASVEADKKVAVEFRIAEAEAKRDVKRAQISRIRMDGQRELEAAQRQESEMLDRQIAAARPRPPKSVRSEGVYEGRIV